MATDTVSDDPQKNEKKIEKAVERCSRSTLRRRRPGAAAASLRLAALARDQPQSYSSCSSAPTLSRRPGSPATPRRPRDPASRNLRYNVRKPPRARRGPPLDGPGAARAGPGSSWHAAPMLCFAGDGPSRSPCGNTPRRRLRRSFRSGAARLGGGAVRLPGNGRRSSQRWRVPRRKPCARRRGARSACTRRPAC